MAQRSKRAEIDQALHDLTHEVLCLETTAAEIQACAGNYTSTSSAEWTFDHPVHPPIALPTPKPKPKPTASGSRSVGSRAPRKNVNLSPGVGRYAPNYGLKHRRSPAFTFGKESTCIVSAKENATGRANREDGIGLYGALSGESPAAALANTSRVRTAPSSVFGKSARPCNAQPPISEGPGFAYCHLGPGLTDQRSSMAQCLSKVERIGKSKGGAGRTDSGEAGPECADYNTEDALKSVEPRVKGVVAWKPVAKKKRNEWVDQEVLQLEAAHEATRPSVKGVISWAAPQPIQSLRTQRNSKTLKKAQKKKRSLASPETTAEQILNPSEKPEQTPIASNAIHVVGDPEAASVGKQADHKIHIIFRAPSKPSKQLLQHQQRKASEASRLGPGAYNSKTPCAVDEAYQQRKKTTNGQKRCKPTLVKGKATERDIPFYDVQKADRVTKPRVRGIIDFSKGPSRSASQKTSKTPSRLSCDKERNRSLPEEREAAARRAYEEKHASSDEEDFAISRGDNRSRVRRHHSRHDSSSPDDEGSSFSDESSLSHSSYSTYSDSSSSEEECKTYSDSGSTADRSNLSRDLYSYDTMRKASRRRTRLNARSTNAKSSKRRGSAWARPLYMETLVGRKYLALRAHKRRKRDEARGPQNFYCPNAAAVQPSVKGVPKFVHPEARTVAREVPSSRSKSDTLLEKLGIADLFDGQASPPPPLAEAPKQHVPTVLFRPPEEPAPQLKMLLQKREEEASRIGPGVYASRTQEKSAKEEVLTLVKKMKAAKARVKGAKTESEKASAERAVADAKASWVDFQESQPFHKLIGRPQDKGDTENGPGAYSIKPHVTRYGAASIKGVPDFSRMRRDLLTSPSSAEGDTLHLDTVALDAVKPTIAGAKGFSFSKVERAVSAREPEEDGPGEEADLEPNYMFGKFSEAGKGLVPLRKITGRDEQEKQTDDVPVLELDVDRANKLVQPRVKGVSFSRMSTRGILSPHTSPKELYGDADYSSRPKQSANVLVDYAKAPPRWHSEDAEDTLEDFVTSRGGDEDMPADRGDFGKGKTLVNMDKQVERWQSVAGDEHLPYKDASYDGADVTFLGGLNAKGKARKNTIGGVSFDLQPSRWPERGLDEAMAGLQVSETELEKPFAVERTRKRTNTGVPMSKQSERWEEKTTENAQTSLDPALVEAGRDRLSKKEPARSWILPMKKSSGRDDLYAGANTYDHHLVHTDVLQAMHAPSQKPRVTGGVIGKSRRSPNVTKDSNDPVIPLNPTDEALRPKPDKGILDLKKMQGRSSDETTFTNKDKPIIAMTEPPMPDVSKGFEALQARIQGGDSTLKPAKGAETSRPLQERQKLDRDIAKAHRTKHTMEVVERKRQVKAAREEQLSRMEGLGTKKEKRGRGARKKGKGEVWQDMRVGLRVFVGNRLNKQRKANA